ncbi:hypothetical protein MKW94_013705 [Papaver nudicaule]|uniref:Wax synthase domain-containing protein n=1 Tax=Papaver nudicaule TaxID=74823 RepID=A0AA41SF55_PAPNU|nr:hypothetical protein [Papaver nudicaule]
MEEYDDHHEINNFIKVWISAFVSLTYCYFIPAKIPKGKFRFVSLLPVFYLFTFILPFKLTTISLGGGTAFFLTWLANFNLILFSIGKGPLSPSLSNPPISFSRFISTSCLPIKLKNPSSNPENQTTTTTNLAIKGLILGLLTIIYEHKQIIHPSLMLVYYCCYLYLCLELLLAMVAAMVSKLLKLDLEPQFNEPFLSTSLQDFWGHRWNLMVPNILKPTVYDPVRDVSTAVIGRKWAPLPATLSTFLVSGLMHELIFFYFGRVYPTWEVTCFFLLQGFCVAVEIWVKKSAKGAEYRLHPVISRPLTVGFVMVTAVWLFFPQVVRFNGIVRVSNEVAAVVGFFKEVGSTLKWLKMLVFSG